MLLFVSVVNAVVWALRNKISTRLLTDIEVVGLSFVVLAVALYVSATGSRGGITSASLIMLGPLFMVIAALSAQRAYQWIAVAIGGALASVIWLEILDLPAFADTRDLFRVIAYPAWLVMVGLCHVIYSSLRRTLGLTAELHASEQQYRGIFDSAADAYVVHRFDGTIVDVNRAARRSRC
jgi:PAS domain-containing protein